MQKVSLLKMLMGKTWYALVIHYRMRVQRVSAGRIKV